MQTFHVQVWQAKVPDFLARHLDFFPACNVYAHVADLAVRAGSIELALAGTFRFTQHGVDEACPDWTQGPEVTLLHDASARSTSVGDVLVIEGVAYGVLDAGFRPLVKKGRQQRAPR
ncbi:hypothetical protein ACFOPQ_07665 [Deinococcus antarcticus]|uniref:Uncharacterized protein n=1 Tax=Deinococcus antarcticus TaxID=1298767 RepID=A0ABV8A829_9DEIO